MRIKVTALTALYLLVVCVAVYDSRYLIGSILNLTSYPSEEGGPNGSGLVEGRVFSLLSDGFDHKGSHWYWPSWNESRRSVSVRDGRVFLNLTDEVDDGGMCRVLVSDRQGGRGNRWLYVVAEIRLRCSDDNGLTGEVGRGMKAWGLADNLPSFPENHLLFRSLSPESGREYSGLKVLSNVDRGSGGFEESVTGIDIREWHNYTIVWRPRNATFLVDDEVVASTDQVPCTPMAIFVEAENTCWGPEGDFPGGYSAGGLQRLSYLDLVDDQSVEVDHVRVFMGEEEYEEYSARMSELVSELPVVIEAVEAEGLNATGMWSDYARFVEEWRSGVHVHAETNLLMLDIMDAALYLDEVSRMFREASEVIAAAREAGSDYVDMFENLFHKAEQIWVDYDFAEVLQPLEMIIEWER